MKYKITQKMPGISVSRIYMPFNQRASGVTALSAVIEASAPDEIIITFSAPLDATSTPAPSAFTISPMRTVTGVVISGDTVTLTVSVPFEYGNVTVSYAKPLTNPLKDLDGEEISDFTRGVMNNTIMIPAALNDGDTIIFLNYDAAETFTLNGSQVQKWIDYISGVNFVEQLTQADQPTLTADGVDFDGISQFLNGVFTCVQPTTIYLVVKQKSWTTIEFLIDGVSNQKGAIQQTGTTPNITAHAGIRSAENANLAIGSWGIVRVLFNGASSKLQVNGTTPTTGDFGIKTMDGLTIARPGSLASYYGNIAVKDIIIRGKVETPTDEADIYNYLKVKYSIPD